LAAEGHAFGAQVLSTHWRCFWVWDTSSDPCVHFRIGLEALGGQLQQISWK